MPHLTGQIILSGPILEVYIGISDARRQALTKAGQPAPMLERMMGLVDTGASGTCVDPVVIKKLGLSPTGTVPIHTPSTAGKAHTCYQYDVSFGLYHAKGSMFHATVPVIETELSTQGFHVLIGRDVLASCLLIYDGAASSFTLAF